MADQTTPSAREHIETDLLGDDLDLDREVARLAALGSPTRFTIMHYLVTTGPTATTDLATQLDHSPTAFADDIQKLADAGLIGRYHDSDGTERLECSPLGESLADAIFATIRARRDMAWPTESPTAGGTRRSEHGRQPTTGMKPLKQPPIKQNAVSI